MGFTFNGIRKESIHITRGFSRVPFAPIQRQFQSSTKQPGAYMTKKRKTLPRLLPIPVYVRAQNKQELQVFKEEIAAWLIHDEPKPLIFDDEPNRIYYPVVDGSFDIEELIWSGKGVIPFVCPDPFKYATSEKTVALGTKIINTGTIETNAIITMTLTNQTNEVTVSHAESGGYVRVLYNFIVGDKLVIDLQKRKVMINNIVRMTSYDWRSKPFELVPGSNTITVTPANTNATAKFTERWL